MFEFEYCEQKGGSRLLSSAHPKVFGETILNGARLNLIVELFLNDILSIFCALDFGFWSETRTIDQKFGIMARTKGK